MYVIPLPTSLPEPAGMHIPDGFVSAPVAAAGYVAAGIVLAIAVRQANRRFQERLVPLMGVMAAFIFAAQMMNFPVAGGTSGHMLGAALATILLGPWAAMIVIDLRRRRPGAGLPGRRAGGAGNERRQHGRGRSLGELRRLRDRRIAGRREPQT